MVIFVTFSFTQLYKVVLERFRKINFADEENLIVIIINGFRYSQQFFLKNYTIGTFDHKHESMNKVG